MAVSLDQVNTLAVAIFRSRERSEHYELRLSLDHLRVLAQKGEIKMDKMNLFGGNDKSSETLFDRKGESSKASFGDARSKEITNQLPPAPIQDENGNLTFELEGKTYSLNVNSEEERERVKKEVNSNSSFKYNWFKEETGKRHWVLYNVKMYKVYPDAFAFLHYRKDSNLVPIVPINATSCNSMFSLFPRLTQLDLSNFNTSNIIDMDSMFYGCSKLTQLGLSNFDTSSVINMGKMFGSCKALTHLDLSSFDTSNVTYMGDMFYGCTSLTQLNLSSFDTSQVTNMCGMFIDCEALTQLDLSNFDTSQVITMGSMFYNCKSLLQLDLSNFNTSNIIDMYYMFYNCKSLAQLDLSGFNTSQVTDIHGMFECCKKLITVYISDKWNTNSVEHSKNMFKDCRSLPGFNPEKRGIEMAKPIEHGGYLTLQK